MNFSIRAHYYGTPTCHLWVDIDWATEKSNQDCYWHIDRMSLWNSWHKWFQTRRGTKQTRLLFEKSHPEPLKGCSLLSSSSHSRWSLSTVSKAWWVLMPWLNWGYSAGGMKWSNKKW